VLVAPTHGAGDPDVQHGGGSYVRGGAPVVVDPVAPPLPLVRFELPPAAA
jgi:hypothetical protein